MFEPTTLPTARSASPLRAASKEVASSGIVVPIATTVKPIAAGVIPRRCAIPTAASTRRLPPIPSPASPARARPTGIDMVLIRNRQPTAWASATKTSRPIPIFDHPMIQRRAIPKNRISSPHGNNGKLRIFVDDGIQRARRRPASQCDKLPRSVTCNFPRL